MQKSTGIVLGVILLLLVGCTLPGSSPPEQLANITNATNSTLSVESLSELLSEPLNDSLPEEPLPVVEGPKPLLSPEPLPLPVPTKQYTDPRDKIQLDYPETWKVRTEISSGFGGYEIELKPLDSVDPDAVVRITYSRSFVSLETEEERLRDVGQTPERRTINGQEFLMYETELELIPGKWTQERAALTVKDNFVFRIILSSRSRHFEGFLPEYEKMLNSVRLL